MTGCKCTTGCTAGCSCKELEEGCSHYCLCKGDCEGFADRKKKEKEARGCKCKGKCKSKVCGCKKNDKLCDSLKCTQCFTENSICRNKVYFDGSTEGGGGIFACNYTCLKIRFFVILDRLVSNYEMIYVPSLRSDPQNTMYTSMTIENRWLRWNVFV